MKPVIRARGKKTAVLLTSAFALFLGVALALFPAAAGAEAIAFSSASLDLSTLFAHAPPLTNITYSDQVDALSNGFLDSQSAISLSTPILAAFATDGISSAVSVTAGASFIAAASQAESANSGLSYTGGSAFRDISFTVGGNAGVFDVTIPYELIVGLFTGQIGETASAIAQVYLTIANNITGNSASDSYWIADSLGIPVSGTLVASGVFFSPGDTGFIDLQAVEVAQAFSPVPESGTMLLLGSGLVGLAGYGRKRVSK